MFIPKGLISSKLAIVREITRRLDDRFPIYKERIVSHQRRCLNISVLLFEFHKAIL